MSWLLSEQILPKEGRSGNKSSGLLVQNALSSFPDRLHLMETET